jgi:hypothetical protein
MDLNDMDFVSHETVCQVCGEIWTIKIPKDMPLPDGLTVEDVLSMFPCPTCAPTEDFLTGEVETEMSEYWEEELTSQVVEFPPNVPTLTPLDRQSN